MSALLAYYTFKLMKNHCIIILHMCALLAYYTSLRIDPPFSQLTQPQKCLVYCLLLRHCICVYNKWDKLLILMQVRNIMFYLLIELCTTEGYY